MTSTNVSYLLYAKTTEAYCLKNLIELLQNSIQQGCFTVSKKGIFFRMADSGHKVLNDCELLSDNFTQYKFKNSSPISIGLNLSHTYKMMKNIKKKDNIVFFIEEDNENMFGIRVISKDKTRVTTSFIKIQDIQCIDVDLPEGYNNPINIPSNDYIKMVKDLNSMGGNTITISSNSSVVKFACNANDIYNRDIIFGDVDTAKDEELYSEEFDTEQITRMTKIAGLNTQLQLFQSENLPLHFKTNIGNLGTMKMYIKNNSQIESTKSSN
jgi:proliferating cell nuclear antigen PCNA